jgi:hypothetical protein
LQPSTGGGVLIEMQAERAPYVGIVLAVLVLAAETIGLVAYATPAPMKAQATAAQSWQQPAHKQIKIRCRR